MGSIKVCTLLLLALLLRDCSCVVWGPKESPSGVRGQGQKTPQVFELPGEEMVEDELQDIINEVSAKDPLNLKRFKRQSSSNNIGYTARLANDGHYQAVVHWTGHPSENIFILTRKRVGGHSTESWLWRSIDYGHSFTNETYKLPDDAVAEWYYISPYSEYLIFSDIINNKLYITDDEGEIYHPVPIPFTPNRILFQSIRAPNSTDSPYSKYVLGYDSSAQTLWASTNLGRNWVQIGQNVTSGRYYWRRLDSDIEGDLSTVYYEQRASENTSRLYTWNTNVTAGLLGQEFSPSIGKFRSGSFVLEREYMFVQKPDTTNVGSGLSPLWVSHKRGAFAQAKFSFVTEQQHYSVIDASEGQVFIAVYHIGNTSNLYISEEKGISYSLTLQDIVSPPERDWVNGNPTIDVHVVEGVVGTYFANRHASSSRYGSTVVSFDKGGRWNPLTPPALDYRGRPLVCAPPACSLHLHMDIDADNRAYQTILSQDSAIGLIMAQGNLGSVLSSFSFRARLYFSRDGGFTWAEVRRGIWEFQFAALGSIVVAVQKRTYVSSVIWTCDEGASWNTSTFVEPEQSRVRVIGIRTEAGEKSRHVTVFGYTGSFQEWLVFDLNFTSVVPNQCNSDDYYDWIPTDERPGSRCLLGEVVAYERRNASKCCYVDPNYEKGTERNACACAIEDFECDFGFERENLNSPCIPYPGNIYPPAPPDPCLEGDNYNYSSGYRKIAGDKCVPGAETYFFRVIRPCPVRPPRFLVIYSRRKVQAGSQATFTLTQFDGAVVSTNYTWNFNDSTAPVTVVGLTNAQSQNHTFTQPGVYTVSVTAVNEGGTAETVQTVRALDTVQSAHITLPSQAFHNEVPTTISLLFNVNIISEYNTSLLDVREYQWSFSDNSGMINSEIPTVSHTYSLPGEYTVKLSVHAPFVGQSSEDSVTLTVYEATSVVDVIPKSSDLIFNEGTNFIPVNAPVTFSPHPQQSGIQLPPDTVNTWHIVKTTPTGGDATNRSAPTLSYSFDSWGVYHVSVIGRSNHTGASFVGQVYITAQNKITSVSTEHARTVRTGSFLTFKFMVSDSASSYEGPLTLSVSTNGTELASSTSMISGEPALVSVEVSGRGVLEYRYVAKNYVSSVDGTETVNVVDTGDYATLAIKFSKLPATFNDSKWQENLKRSVRSAIVELIPSSLDLVEVVAVKVVEENVTVSDSQNLLKRAAGLKKEIFVYVTVNILPAKFSDEGTAQAIQLAELIVAEAMNGSLIVLVDGNTLTISSANVATGGIIIEPPQYIDQFDATKYAAIGGALGAFVILALVMTVVLVLIVYTYRRKYNRLHVRYSRLQQTPVRFTFTAGGEMVEEDCDEDTDDEEVDGINMKPT